MSLPLGGLTFIILSYLVVVGSSNAVNLTDGLDGLAIVPVMIAAGVFALIAYLAGNSVFSGYLQINYVPGSGELAVFCGSVIGSGLGFLWYNAPPAKVFMGDTGSLALGGALGAVSIITNFAAGMSKNKLSHQETLENAGMAEKNILNLIKKFILNFTCNFY